MATDCLGVRGFAPLNSVSTRVSFNISISFRSVPADVLEVKMMMQLPSF